MKGKAAAKSKTKAPRKAKKEKKTGPKKPKSAFIFFSQERRENLKFEKPDLGITDASKILGAEWRGLTDADKQRFNELAATDRARYAREKGEVASASD